MNRHRQGFASAMVLMLLLVAGATANLAFVAMVTRRRAGNAHAELVQLREYAWCAVQLPPGETVELDGWTLKREADRALAVHGERAWVISLDGDRVVDEGEAP